LALTVGRSQVPALCRAVFRGARHARIATGGRRVKRRKVGSSAMISMPPVFQGSLAGHASGHAGPAHKSVKEGHRNVRLAPTTLLRAIRLDIR